MPQESDILDLYTNVQTQVQSLGLQFTPPGGEAFTVGVEIKKFGFWMSKIALPILPVIYITGADEPESVEPFTSENIVLAKYLTTIMTIAAGNRDNTANLDTWWNWREQERRLFQWGMQAQIVSCFKTEFVPNSPLTKEGWLKNYDVSALTLRLWNAEVAKGPVT